MTLQSSMLIAVLAGYGLLIGVGGALAALERRQAHQQLVVAVVDGITSGNDVRVELWRYKPFGLTAWLEPGGSTAPGGPHLLESGGQSWMQSRTSVQLPQRGWHTLVVRQNVTSTIARQRTLLLLLLAAAGLASLFTAALLRPVLRRDLVRPIEALCSRLQSISGLQWVRGPVLEPEEQPQELQPIAESFRALQRRLAAAWQRERTFTDGVAHELRTPITLISGQAQSLLRQPLATEQRRAVASIAAEARHMTTLVRDLLDLARQDADRLQLQCRPVDPEALMLEAFDRLRSLAPQRLQLLPAGAVLPPVAVQADPERLLQCISALVENALAYSTGPVQLELGSFPNQVVWHVRDRGPGVQREEQAAIFQRFVRGSAAVQSDTRGSGLGLAVVRLLMEAMGGWVSVTSVPGGGADFQLRLPLQQVTSPVGPGAG
jgi:signal transduction histidine kinase